MRSGKLRHRIEIQRDHNEGLVQDDLGQPEEDWRTEDVRWASIEPLSGEKFFQAQQVQAKVSHRVRLRNYPGLSPDGWRFLFEGRIFNIEAVLDQEEKNTEMEVMCQEVV
jgi:SPP1 family predicted phage head-tail adaptor